MSSRACPLGSKMDIIIFSNSAEEHLQHIQRVMEMLDAVNLRFHPSKSIFMADSVQYLGHFVGPWGLSPSAAKVQAIMEMHEPTSVEEVRSAMGLFLYYSRYVPGFSCIARPITDLTKKGVPFKWTEDCARSYAKCHRGDRSSEVGDVAEV